MSEIIKCCDNCKHYELLFCNYKKMYKTQHGVCEHWEEDVLSTTEIFEGAKKEIEQINDPVSHPSHYTEGNIEVIDYIEDKEFNFNLGNVVKYVSRAGKKDVNKTIQDLEKGAWYLDREIKRLKGELNREISNLEKNV